MGHQQPILADPGARDLEEGADPLNNALSTLSVYAVAYTPKNISGRLDPSADRRSLFNRPPEMGGVFQYTVERMARRVA
jgi:hypothetical protein